jgi:lipopolysaccharide transport system ATP-binding protein
MNDTVISVENLSKSYLVGHRTVARGGRNYVALRDVVARGAHNFVRKAADVIGGRQVVQGDEIEEFWALKELNFEVKRGEVLGIIGRNGAGKSTLLKILSRITEPTTGRVELRARVASLLEVGTGFHPELSGRENVYLNGAILGMSRSEVTRKFDEIVSFAEIAKFVDTPVKRYSSGMYVRLAFAVAAHLESELLIVDEVLAVGDSIFQRKCLEKISEMSREGRTIIFVSHNISSVRYLSTACMYLVNGKISAAGSVDECLAKYLDIYDSNQTIELDRARRLGDGRIRFTAFWTEKDDGERSSSVIAGGPCTLAFSYTTKADDAIATEQVDVGFGLHAPSGERLLLLYASHVGQEFRGVLGNGVFKCRLPALPLASGRYTVWPRIEIDGVEVDYPQDAIGSIEVEELDFYGSGRRMGQHGHGHAPFLIRGDWTKHALHRSQ